MKTSSGKEENTEMTEGKDGGRKRAMATLEGECWVRIPACKVIIGSEDDDFVDDNNETPAHQVSVTSFRISRYPVTNEQYKAYVEETACDAPAHWLGGNFRVGTGDHPVVQVSWGEAMTFCAWLTKQLVADGGGGSVQLPTETMWEIAARGTEAREYPWGNEEPDINLANYDASFVRGTTAVTQYPDGATPEGIFDLAGNVMEWCLDWFGPYTKEAKKDPTGPDGGHTRVLRGSTYEDPPWTLRAAARRSSLPDYRADQIGFRLAWREKE